MKENLNKTALLSVSNKTGVEKLAAELASHNYRILATGNTAKLIKENGIEVTEISNFTGSPEIFNGRVKTLHPKVFGGILLRRDNPSDVEEAEKNNIEEIDVVCVNLYPFKETTKKTSSLDDIIENIDIGGPSLIRASAKNYKYVSVLTHPDQYDEFIAELKNGISEDFRKKLSAAAFSHTAEYDNFIAGYLENRFDISSSAFRLNLEKEKDLRYGENPHQSASVYGEFSNYFESIHGKDLSYNNILDLISAVEIVEDIGEESNFACTIIKHNNPAGAAIGKSSLDAYKKALRCDPVSAFGGIVSFNKEVNSETAEVLNEIFLEVISAPSFSREALEILKKKKDRRLILQKKSIGEERISFRNIPGGIILQDADLITLQSELNFVTERSPSEDEMEDLKFAWKIAKHVKSNAIVFVKNKATLGVGAGQMSRIDSVKIAKMKAEEHGNSLQNSVAASDAFFPFADGLIEIINCGAVSVIQPGGSVRDNEVIEAANKNKISMVLTGVRHFKH